MRTGCQWNALPAQFGDDSSVHRWFQRWCELGVMERIWADLVAECEELKQVHWDWQSADGCMGKARHGGDKVGKSPTDRGKKGTKRSVVVDEQGGPLGVVIDGPTATTPSCSKRLLRPSSWAALTQTSTHSTCAWTRAMTTPLVETPPLTPSTSHTSARSVRRSWPSRTSTPMASRVAGSSNAPSPGSTAAAPSWS